MGDTVAAAVAAAAAEGAEREMDVAAVAAVEVAAAAAAGMEERADVRVRGAPGGGGVGARSAARVQVRYDAHLPTLSLWDRGKVRTILAGTVLPTVHGHIVCKNWHLCRLCWEECEHKTRTFLPNQMWRQPSPGC